MGELEPWMYKSRDELMSDRVQELQAALTTAQARIAELQALVEWRTDWESAPKNEDLWGWSRGQSVKVRYKVHSDGTSGWHDHLGLQPTHYRLITPPESKP